MPSPPVATQQDTINELLKKSGRPGSVPIRRGFVQQGRRSELRPGPLAAFVRNHDGRGLDLYTLALALASHEPFQDIQPSGVWARALGLRGLSRRAAVSRAWKRLEDLQLVSRSRRGRTAVVTLLREDGSGDPYTYLGSRGDPYFQLPLAYFYDAWYRQMDLATKAVLLIALSLREDFYLPSDWVSRWYGLSADTAERGLAKLRSLGLLERELHFKPAPLTDQGWTKEYTYRLRAPFARTRTTGGRGAVQKKGVRLSVIAAE
jgi:DNA-binding transcriptional ArsR family regulator